MQLSYLKSDAVSDAIQVVFKMSYIILKFIVLYKSVENALK